MDFQIQNEIDDLLMNDPNPDNIESKIGYFKNLDENDKGQGQTFQELHADLTN